MLKTHQQSAEVIYQYQLISQFKNTMFKQTKFLLIKEQLAHLGYDATKTLGSGGFGDVVLAVKNGKNYAVKSIPKEIIASRPELSRYIKNEYEVMKALQHKNIIKQEGHIENQDHFFMLLEYCNLGNLLTLQSKRVKKCFSLKQTVKIISDVLKGLKQIHMNKFIHRDIKPENILLKQEDGGVVYKIADFGFARPIENNSVGTHCGTSSFMAPQILSHKPYGISVDLWALGVVMYFMLFAEYPFKSMNLLTDIETKCYKGFDIRKQLKKEKLEEYSQELQDFFCKIFVVDPKKRITMTEIFTHPIFASQFDFLKEKDSPRSTLESDASQENLAFKEEIKELDFQKEKVEFLKNIYAKLSDSFRKIMTNAKDAEILTTQYYLLKAIIFYTKKSLIALTSKILPTHFKDLHKWSQFCQSTQANKFSAQLEQELAQLNSEYREINKTISKAKIDLGSKQNLNPEVTENEFEQFKVAYRATIGNLFKLVHTNETISSSIKNQIKLQMICCHLINRVFQHKHIEGNFQKYLTKFNRFNSKSFFSWIGEENKQILDKTITHLHKRYLNTK